MPLEGPDEQIKIGRAAAIAGLAPHTLSVQAQRGKLQTIQRGHLRFTTRRWLHAYLLAAVQHNKGTRKPLPADYQAPE